MNKNHFFILLILLIHVRVATAQDENHNSISLNWGMGNLMRQDISFSDLIHSKWSPVNVRLEYNRSNHLEQQAVVQVGLYKPMIGDHFEYNSFYNGIQPTLPHSFLLLDINYSLGKVLLHKEKWDLVLGGRSANRLNSSNYDFGPAGSYGYYYSFGIDLWMKVKYRLSEKHRFTANLALPLIGFNSRSPYLSQDDEYHEYSSSHRGMESFLNQIGGGKFQSWGSYQNVDFDLSYSYALSKRWDLGLTYVFVFNKNQVPTHFTQFENIFYLTANIKF